MDAPCQDLPTVVEVEAVELHPTAEAAGGHPVAVDSVQVDRPQVVADLVEAEDAPQRQVTAPVAAEAARAAAATRTRGTNR
jgi:hypothetical protein